MSDEKCPHCGAAMMPINVTGKDGKTVRRFICSREGFCKIERMLKEAAQRKAA